MLIVTATSDNPFMLSSGKVSRACFMLGSFITEFLIRWIHWRCEQGNFSVENATGYNVLGAYSNLIFSLSRRETETFVRSLFFWTEVSQITSKQFSMNVFARCNGCNSHLCVMSLKLKVVQKQTVKGVDDLSKAFSFSNQLLEKVSNNIFVT